MVKPLVSIIVPIRNEEQFLPECFDSIKIQTFEDFECIFINDGSTDNTVKLIKNYISNDKRFKLIEKEYSGLIPSINLGIAKSLGMIICRMDGDDIMPEKRIEMQVKKLINCGPGSLITGKIKYFPAKQVSIGYKEYESWLNSLDKHEQFLKNAFIECPVASPSWIMFKNDILKLGCFDDDIYPEDFNFILKALNNNIKFYSLNEIVLFWRDYQSRTSKVSYNYSRKNFWNVRARHLPSYIRNNSNYKECVIFGVGSNGKQLCNALHVNNCFPKYFIDIHAGRIGRNVCRTPVISYKDINVYKDYYILIALRDRNAKKEIKDYLSRINKKVVKDYIYCC